LSSARLTSDEMQAARQPYEIEIIEHFRVFWRRE
jgi:hypothetical protein